MCDQMFQADYGFANTTLETYFLFIHSSCRQVSGPVFF